MQNQLNQINHHVCNIPTSATNLELTKHVKQILTSQSDQLQQQSSKIHMYWCAHAASETLQKEQAMVCENKQIYYSLTVGSPTKGSSGLFSSRGSAWRRGLDFAASGFQSLPPAVPKLVFCTRLMKY